MKSASSSTACSISIVVALALTLNQCAYAARLPHIAAAPQVAMQTPTAPPPAQIEAAHTVFLTNAGADPSFPVDSTQSFNDIYAGLRAWGRFQLVNSPEQADLIFELHGEAPVSGVTGVDGDISSYTSPAFQLTIRDPRNDAVLWTITSPVVLAGRNKELAQWVAQSEKNLISRIKVVSGETLTAAETDGLTTMPKLHTGRVLLIVIGVPAAAAVAGGFILHHEYENGLASQKASTDAFCQANHIPLSQCAGG
jgi:hypothetical protein